MAATTKIVAIIAWLTVGVTSQLPYAYKTPSHPAQYKYDWRVQDAYSANDFGQEEARSGYNIDGGYSVLLPDGRKQIVTYKVADAHSGYVADVRYEGEAKYEPYHPPQPGAVPFTVHTAGALGSYTPAPAPKHHTTFATAPAAAPYVPHAAPSYSIPHITAPAYPTTHYRPHHPKTYHPTAPAYPVHPVHIPHRYNFKPVVVTTAPAPVEKSTPAPAPSTTLAPKKIVTEPVKAPVYIPSYKRPKVQYAANRLDDVINGSLFYSDLGRIKAQIKSKPKHSKTKEHGHSY